MQNERDWTPRETDRLLLRRPQSGDLAVALAIHLDPRTNQHHPEPETVTRDSVTSRFLGMIEHWDQYGFGVWFVAMLGAPERIVGFTGLSHRTVHQRDALNLYYRYRPEAWGNRVASEAAGAAVALGQKFLPGLPIVAYTSADNLGSQRTALAVGLERRTDLDLDQGSYTDVYFSIGW